MDTTPRSLLERVHDPNDRDAWNELIAVVSPFLYGVARQNGLQEADAADLVQEVWVTAVRTLPAFHYDPRRSFRAWLTVLFRRKLIDYRRRMNRVILAPPTRIEPAASNELIGEEEYRQWLAIRAWGWIETHCSSQEIAILREYVQNGRPAAKVAAGLGITANAVYLTKQKTLVRLRKYFNGLL